jgi:hypothetical protein
MSQLLIAAALLIALAAPASANSYLINFEYTQTGLVNPWAIRGDNLAAQLDVPYPSPPAGPVFNLSFSGPRENYTVMAGPQFFAGSQLTGHAHFDPDFGGEVQVGSALLLLLRDGAGLRFTDTGGFVMDLGATAIGASFHAEGTPIVGAAEPASAGLLALLFGGFAAIRWRRRI